ncbi:hypothetical protein B0H16DRAFT_777070 [Mycena metata]|uniref:F-box domain-containing protein n=1 Tax=Mycena metata TaxID=1033252 RepID=A0AAD7DV21_9AGAR|nr:hypothetical protein B0H16DRAFT_777070 [Mycena metata]
MVVFRRGERWINLSISTYLFYIASRLLNIHYEVSLFSVRRPPICTSLGVLTRTAPQSRSPPPYPLGVRGICASKREIGFLLSPMSDVLPPELLDEIIGLYYLGAYPGGQRNKARACICLVSRLWCGRAYTLRLLWTDITIHLWTTQQYLLTSLERSSQWNISLKLDMQLVHNCLYDPAFDTRAPISPWHSVEHISSVLIPLLRDAYARVETLSTAGCTSVEWLCLMRAFSAFDFPSLRNVRYSVSSHPRGPLEEGPPTLPSTAGSVTQMCLVSVHPLWTHANAYAGLRDLRLQGWFAPMDWSTLKTMLRASPALETLYLEYIRCLSIGDQEVISLPSLRHLHVVYGDDRGGDNCGFVNIRMEHP